MPAVHVDMPIGYFARAVTGSTVARFDWCGQTRLEVIESIPTFLRHVEEGKATVLNQ
jgi:hypothetical protein